MKKKISHQSRLRSMQDAYDKDIGQKPMKSPRKRKPKM